MGKENEGVKVLAVNKKARFHFFIDESVECGIVLKGTEVKSVKDGRFSFVDSYAQVTNGELWLLALHITPYEFGNRVNHDPLRKRKLLAHKKEITHLRRVTEEKGLTLVPLKFYLKRGIVKCELGVARGKKLFDKRDDIKKKDQTRELRQHYRMA
jgi:SsrA-binding protein